MGESRLIQQFVKGQTIVAEGSQGDRTYRILAGEVLVCKNNQNNELVPIAKLGPGEMFGEMYLFEQNGTRSASVIASSSEVKVEVIFQDDLSQMLGDITPTMANLLMGFTHRLRQTSQDVSELHPHKHNYLLPDEGIKALRSDMTAPRQVSELGKE